MRRRALAPGEVAPAPAGGDQRRYFNERLHRIRLRGAHGHHSGAGAAVGREVPEGVLPADARVHLVQHAPDQARAGGAVVRMGVCGGALPKAGQFGQHAEAAQLRQLRQQLSPVEARQQRGTQTQQPMPKMGLRPDDAEVDGQPTKGERETFPGHGYLRDMAFAEDFSIPGSVWQSPETACKRCFWHIWKKMAVIFVIILGFGVD